jgi:signal peptidase
MNRYIIILCLSALVLTSALTYMPPVRTLTISGHSMEPVITSSDVIVVKPVDPASLMIGDVITYKYETDGGTVTITHRIVEINNGFTTKGDSNNVIDNYVVEPSDVVGIFWFKIPYLGSFIHFAHTDAGYVSLILMPAILLIAIETRKIIKYRRSGDE